MRNLHNDPIPPRHPGQDAASHDRRARRSSGKKTNPDRPSRSGPRRA